MSVYQQLQEILDIHPASAPASPHFDEILRTLFTNDEAGLAIHMNFSPKAVEKIAESARIDPDKAARVLEGMAKKVIIFFNERDGKKYYGLVPTIPGLFEFPFMKGGGTPMHDKLGKLWSAYHNDALGESFAGSPTPQMRVVPVEKSLTAQSIAHPYEEVVQLIQTSDYISLAQCACRVSVKKCEAPKDVCLIFGAPGKFLVSQGYAKEIDKNEAIAVLDRAEAAGLVHTSNNSEDKASVICNCCPCCCTILRGKTELKHPHAFATSAWIPTWDQALCSFCGICADERCPMEAVSFPGDIFDVDPENCIGCGLCVSGCPEEALSLVRRENPPEVLKSLQEMGMTVLQEKGKLEKFAELMQK
ncbi:MAG: 4Fe-4S binding protein [Proteobacteria bacterium]|nr:hypothetical protein [Desulfobacula sp.]MBU4131234.1 4Fe-4S binding protein [Pseudomonadota bacterium]